MKSMLFYSTTTHKDEVRHKQIKLAALIPPNCASTAPLSTEQVWLPGLEDGHYGVSIEISFGIVAVEPVAERYVSTTVTDRLEFVSDNDLEMFQDDVSEELVQYLTSMRTSFEKYFPEKQNTEMKLNSWIHNPFTQLAKARKIRDEYPMFGKMALNILLPFPTTYLCETGFSTYAATKTEYRNRLDGEPYMRLQLSSLKLDINKLMKNQKQFHNSH
ncbi:Zinc finger BED domain-containing protein 5 [Eumeta japonica]|uniref:Zinc finger BED domain-containing protein 5 n=1 Tax=Eumeta variegata TaxID=151549 RepID=A0A4C1Z628_EUMVA|nr:Zinc finger BED domain-containing protein 5 [Eumeta japonica]